jgi:hypothetical protein
MPPVFEIDRVARLAPDGSQYVSRDEASLPAGAGLVGLDDSGFTTIVLPTPDLQGFADQVDALLGAGGEDGVAQSGQAIGFTAFLPAPANAERIAIQRGGVLDEYEFVDISGAPPWALTVPFAIAVPFTTAASGRAALAAAVNGTAVATVPPVEEAGGGPAAPINGTLAYRAVLLADQESVLVQVADAQGGAPIFDPMPAFGDTVQDINLLPPNEILEANAAGFHAPASFGFPSREQVTAQIGASIGAFPTVYRQSLDKNTLAAGGAVLSAPFAIGFGQLPANAILVAAGVRVVTALTDGAAGTFTADIYAGGDVPGGVPAALADSVLAAPLDVSSAPGVEARMDNTSGLTIAPAFTNARHLVCQVIGSVNLSTISGGDLEVYAVVATV